VALPLMLVAGIAGGAAWAAIPALLRNRLGANEILTSLMLTYVAALLLSALVFGPLKDPQGYNFPQSPMFADDEMLPVVVPGTRVTAGTVFCLLLPIAGWLLLGRTVSGFAIRAFGESPAAARFGGFSQARTVWLVMLVSGGLAGLAGCFEVAGPIGQLIPVVSPGYGFTAIIVAFLGRLHPLGIIPAGLLMALSYVGGDLAQVAVGLPKGATGVVQGMLLFFPLGADALLRYRIVWNRTVAA
jgi:simple sugar transport system permease protein